MDQKAKDHFEKANEQMRNANDELYKPQEDVVTFKVCKNSLFAIENYLKGFISQRGYNTNKNESLDQLMERCRLLDKNFRKVDVNLIDCSSNPDHNRFCEDINKVNSCFEAADQLQNFFIRHRIL